MPSSAPLMCAACIKELTVFRRFHCDLRKEDSIGSKLRETLHQGKVLRTDDQINEVVTMKLCDTMDDFRQTFSKLSDRSPQMAFTFSP